MPEVAVKFLRMSDERRQKPENSIPAQNRSIDAGILTNSGHPLYNIPIIRTFELLHRSHEGLQGVRVFDEMIQWAREGRFKYILVDKYDRFGRDIYEAMELEKEFNGIGVYVVSAKEHFDVAQPAGWLAKTLMQVLADFYSRNLAGEVKKGMREKLERGEWPWGAPVGYRHRENRRDARGHADSTLVEDVERCGPMIRRAFEEFATGRYTMKTWTQHASAQGLRGRNGGRLPESSWNDILHNRIYVGKMRTRMFPDMEFEAHPDTPRLCSDEIFERVQRILEERWNGAEHRQLFTYPLLPVLWSAEGRCRMWGETQRTRGISYYRTKEPVGLKRIYISRRVVEAGFERLVDTLTLSPEALGRVRAELEQIVAEQGKRSASEVEALRSQEARLRTAGRNLVRMHSMGDITYDEFQQERRLNMAALREVQDKLDALRGPVEKRMSDLDLALRLMGRLGDLWRELDNDLDRELFAKLVFKRVTIKRSGAPVSWKLNEPFSTLYEFPLHEREGAAEQVTIRFPQQWRVPNAWRTPSLDGR